MPAASSPPLPRPTAPLPLRSRRVHAGAAPPDPARSPLARPAVLVCPPFHVVARKTSISAMLLAAPTRTLAASPPLRALAPPFSPIAGHISHRRAAGDARRQGRRCGKRQRRPRAQKGDGRISVASKRGHGESNRFSHPGLKRRARRARRRRRGGAGRRRTAMGRCTGAYAGGAAALEAEREGKRSGARQSAQDPVKIQLRSSQDPARWLLRAPSPAPGCYSAPALSLDPPRRGRPNAGSDFAHRPTPAPPPWCVVCACVCACVRVCV